MKKRDEDEKAAALRRKEEQKKKFAETLRDNAQKIEMKKTMLEREVQSDLRLQREYDELLATQERRRAETLAALYSKSQRRAAVAGEQVVKEAEFKEKQFEMRLAATLVRAHLRISCPACGLWWRRFLWRNALTACVRLCVQKHSGALIIPHALCARPRPQKAKEESDAANAAAKAAKKAKATQEQLSWLARQVEDREEQKVRAAAASTSVRPHNTPTAWPRNRGLYAAVPLRSEPHFAPPVRSVAASESPRARDALVHRDAACEEPTR